MYAERLLLEYFQISYTGWGGLLWIIGLRIVEFFILSGISLLIMFVFMKFLRGIAESGIPKFFSVGTSEVRLERTKSIVISVVRYLTIFMWISWGWFVIYSLMLETGMIGELVTFQSWLGVLYKLVLILFILVGVEIFISFINFAIDKWVDSVEDDVPELSVVEKRARTISFLLRSTFRYLLYFVAFMMIFREVGLDIGPALAGAGVVGLAIGFGAQTLVKDVLSGFFILFENQFHVGDFIKIQDVAGTVEKMALRMTIIRSYDGALHMFPNSSLDRVTVLSRGFSRAIIHVGVSYNEDVDLIRKNLDEIVAEFSHPDLLEQPTVLGVTELGDSSVTFRIVAQTKPLSHWSVERELRQAVKRGLDQRGIEIPFPQRVIHHVYEGKIPESLSD